MVKLMHLWADVSALKIKLANLENLTHLKSELTKVLGEADLLKARIVLFRLIKGEFAEEEIKELLPKFGFKKKSERIEFKKSVDLLTSDQGSPLVWRTAEELGYKPEDIAKVLEQVASGDPEMDESEDPLKFIQDFLHDPVLTSGLSCIHFGFIDCKVAAMTVVQINPSTGWSRISYMGVMPNFRKQNLGVWVHRYGFVVMKKEGGKLYHGGTSSTNKRMIRLFEVNDCERFCDMEEWVLMRH